MNIEPITLAGEHVRMEPLTIEHLDDLCEVGFDESLWRWTPSGVTERNGMLAYIEYALADQERGAALPFVTIERASGKVVGSTRYCAIDAANLRAEIGWTWINPAWQRTFVNTEAKYLMLKHAFESWQCNRVELKTDQLNERSQNAILRLGAKQEGIFRQHIVCANGRLRDTVYFSIIKPEWPNVRSALEKRLER